MKLTNPYGLSLLTAGLIFSACGADATTTDSPAGASGAGSNNGGGGKDPEQDAVAQQTNGACPTDPDPRLQGTAPAGAACTAATDCAPTCCPCPSSSASWLGAACRAGVCQNAANACEASSKDQNYCSAPVTVQPGGGNPQQPDKPPTGPACAPQGQWRLSFTRNVARNAEFGKDACQDAGRAAFAWNVEVTQASDGQDGFYLRAPADTVPYVGEFNASTCVANVSVVEPIGNGNAALVKGKLSLVFASGNPSGLIAPVFYDDCLDAYRIQMTKL